MRLSEAQIGSERLGEVEGSSGASSDGLQEAQTRSRTFRTIQEASEKLKEAPRGSRRHRKAQSSGMLREAQIGSGRLRELEGG